MLGQVAPTNEFEQKDQLYQDIFYLSSDLLEGRQVGTEGEVLAAGYIAYKFAEIGLTPSGDNTSYLQKFSVRQRANPHSLVNSPEDSLIYGYNVVGAIDNGSENTVVIGAHYDHLGWGNSGGSLHAGEKAIHNGADDNASGTAAIIQIAKRLKNSSKTNNYIFIAFSGEEEGLWGSNYYAKKPSVDIHSINYMINLDMVGRLNDEKKLSIHGTGTSPLWPEALDKANTMGLSLILSESGIGPSDHTSFYKNDIPVLHFFTGQHRDYHKPSDDIEHINFDGIIDIIDFIENVIRDVSDDGKLAFTKTKEEKNDNPRFKVTLGVMPDYLFDGKGMRIDAVNEGRPAAAADLKAGDIVIKLGDTEVVDMMSYMKALAIFNNGDETTVEVKRGKEVIVKKIKFNPKE
jgi:hypothetical protein